MSTKVHHGIRFRETDLTRLHEHIMEWRQRMSELRKQAETAYYADQTAKMIDAAIADGTDLPTNPMSIIYQKTMDAQREIDKTGRRNPAVDFEFKVMILPFEGSVYGLVFTEQPEWGNEFTALPWVEPYPYWDNTDPDPDVSEEEWAERGRIWDDITKPDRWDRPSACGYSADCTAVDGVPEVDDVIAAAPSIEVRSRRAAYKRVLDQRLTEVNADLSKGFSELFEAEKYLKGDEGQERLRVEEARLAQILPLFTKTLINY